MEDGSSTGSGILITNDHRNTSVTVMALGDCNLKMVAVGGGGPGGVAGGGGSGYLKWKELPGLQGYLAIEVDVGRSWRSSLVIEEGGETLLEAKEGNGPNGLKGGSGFSGGGGCGESESGSYGKGGHGGTNGGNGEAGTGGTNNGSGGGGSGGSVLGSVPLTDFHLM